MSFLKITDPAKRDLIVKEYLETKKNIRDSQLAERTGEQGLQTGLSKFFRPITETQKATTKEITEGLKPIKEGIEQLPQQLPQQLPPPQLRRYPRTSPPPSYRRSQLSLFEDPEEEMGAISLLKDTDRTFGIYEGGKSYIGNKQFFYYAGDNDIIIGDKKYEATDGLWELITSNNPSSYSAKDYSNYVEILKETNALQRGNNPNNPYPKSSKGQKWKFVKPIWERLTRVRERKITGEGIVIPCDPNALIERLDLLMASKAAGNTGVRNELVSICDELKRQGVLNSSSYKNLMSILEKMITTRKRGFKRKYSYGGAGIFDSIANFFTKLFASNGAKQIASSVLDVGKSVAKEGAKKALEAGKSAAVDAGKRLVEKALTPKSRKILQKHTATPAAQSTPTAQNINSLIDGSDIAIQDLVKKLNSGSGIRVL